MTTIGKTTIYGGHEAPNESRVFGGRLEDDRDQAPDEAQDDEQEGEQ